MLLANGTLNYETLYIFGYEAHWELSKIGKQFTHNFFQYELQHKALLLLPGLL
jgi:hypothetical protein